MSRLPVLAKVAWQDPHTGDTHEFFLTEGATASIGRLESNDICIKEQHVSRQHAVVNYRDGIFLVTDLGSANGVWVNDHRVNDPYPLASGDEIRLYVPTLTFDAVLNEEDATTGATVITALMTSGGGRLLITNGPQEGTNIPLLGSVITVGRATTKADWEICLQDPSVSRPHARFEMQEAGVWVLYDLGSANGTLINGTPVTEKGRMLRDGDVITFGATLTLFRAG